MWIDFEINTIGTLILFEVFASLPQAANAAVPGSAKFDSIFSAPGRSPRASLSLPMHTGSARPVSIISPRGLASNIPKNWCLLGRYQADP
jgi:hypothetical protein